MDTLLADIDELEKLKRVHRGEHDMLYFMYEYFSEEGNPGNPDNLIPAGVTMDDAAEFHQTLCGLLDDITTGREKKKKVVALVFGIISGVLALCGLLQVSGILPGIPILTYGIPAVLSCYFDLFSGFVQAYVFTLLTMVYISGSLPEPKPAETT